MSYQSNNLNLEILEESDPADLTTVSDNFDKIDAAIGDIATFETSPTTAAHSVGEYLLYEGRLYKVTTAISAGANLTLGTNVSAANIGDDIKTLQDSVSLSYPLLTYVTNAYVSQTEFDRCMLIQVAPHLTLLRINMSVSPIPTNTTVKFAKLPFSVAQYINEIAAVQGTSAHLNIAAYGNTVELANHSGSSQSGWVRLCVPLPM